MESECRCVRVVEYDCDCGRPASLPEMLGLLAVAIVIKAVVPPVIDAGAAVVRPVGRGLFGAVRRGGRAVRRGSARALLGLSRRLEPADDTLLREKAAEARAAAEAGG